MKRSSTSIAAATAIVAGSLAAFATSSDAVTGFTGGKGMPWSYLGVTGNATPSALTESCSGLAGITCVSNGLSQPAHISVIDNLSGGAVTIGTARILPNTLNLDPANGMVIARWTAPAAGVYDITGSFTGDDIAEAPHAVLITDDIGAPLLPATLLSAFGAATNFSVANVKFAVGDFVDFMAYATDGYTNLNTGFDATITSADPPPADVPEPGSLSLLGSALIALGVARRALKVQAARRERARPPAYPLHSIHQSARAGAACWRC